MEDYNSETDSDYTSYWRDWDQHEFECYGTVEDLTKLCNIITAMGKQTAAAVYDRRRTQGGRPIFLKQEREEDGDEPTSTESDRPALTPASYDQVLLASTQSKKHFPISPTRDIFPPYHTSADGADFSSVLSLESEPALVANMLRSGRLSQWNDSSGDYGDSSANISFLPRESRGRPQTTKLSMNTTDVLNWESQNAKSQLSAPLVNQHGNGLSMVSTSGTAAGIIGDLVVPDADFMIYFTSSRGNEYFCEIDEDYLTDRFNLTGINVDVQYYQYALDLVTDVFELDCDDDMREQIEKSARHLYGLVHARYITTTRGLTKMLEKYKKGDFGKCPRVMCSSHPLLPTGLSDNAHIQSVKLYCGKCEDLYNPKSSRHANIDGAYFGTSFQNILFQVYPTLVPEKTICRYEPKVFGFKVHATAALERWQSTRREEMLLRLRELGFGPIFKEDVESGGEEVMEDDDDDGEGIDGLEE